MRSLVLCLLALGALSLSSPSTPSHSFSAPSHKPSRPSSPQLLNPPFPQLPSLSEPRLLRLRGSGDDMEVDISALQPLNPSSPRPVDPRQTLNGDELYHVLNFSDALDHLRPSPYNFGSETPRDPETLRGSDASSPLVLTVGAGEHNLTEYGDLVLQRPVVLSGTSKTTLIGSAVPRQFKETSFTDNKGGRWMLSFDATGSIFKSFAFDFRDHQCMVVNGAAVLIQQCSLRTCLTIDVNYASVIWVENKGHVNLLQSRIGGKDVENRCTSGVVVDNSRVSLVQTAVEFCESACISMHNNASARIFNSSLIESHAALSIGDGNINYPKFVKVDGSVEIVNSTVRCIYHWRDNDRPKDFRESGTQAEDYKWQEFARAQEEYQRDELLWYDKDDDQWKSAGVTAETRRKEKEYYKRYAVPGEIDLEEVRKSVQQKKPWDSSGEEEDSGALIEQGIERKITKPTKGMEFDHRRSSLGKVQATLAERYQSSTGHPGNPPVPRNRHFHGLHKIVKAKALQRRHTYKR